MRTIDADALKKVIEEKVTYIDGDSVYKIIDLIDNAPTVKPKQGEWKKIGEIGLAYKCNKCGEVDVVPTNFCPNCGAPMKGGAE